VLNVINSMLALSMRQSASRRQSGATLITALIMLLMLTVLAISGSGSAILETRLANNLKFRNQAQEMAEYALRTAEADIEALLTTSSQIMCQFNPAINPGFGSPILKNGTVNIPFNFTNPNNRSGWAAANSVQVASTNTNLQARYVVEYVGRVGLPPADIDDVDRRHYAFRITAIGYSLEGNNAGNASYLLQSTYSKPLAGTGALIQTAC